MSKKNWFIEANKSTDPAVKALLEQYNTLDANAPDTEEKRKALSQEIKVKLGLADPATENDQTEPAAPETPTADAGETPDAPESDESDENPTDGTPGETPDEPTPDTPSDPTPDAPAATEPATPKTPEKTIFSYTEDDAAKAKDIPTLELIKKSCREEISRLEKTRLKHGTYQQNRELDMKIWAVRRIVGIALKREAGLKERAHRAAKIGRTSGVAMKRARFVKLIKQGISITNITKHPDGVKKAELESVLDPTTIEACRKHNSKFPEMWEKWKNKFIIQPEKIKSLLAELLEVNPDYKSTGAETAEQLQEMIDKAKENKA